MKTLGRWVAQWYAPGWHSWEAMLFAVILPLVAVTGTGCAGSLESARPKTLSAESEPSPYCQGLDSKRQTWGAVAKGAAVVAGASGVSTLPLEGDRYETARIGVAAAGVGAAAVAAGAVFISEAAGDRWAEQCAVR